MNLKRAIAATAAIAASSSCFAALKIVTTTPDLASIAQAVGGKNVSVSALVTGARDPHRIEAKPSYMSRVASADLFLAIGLDLEVGYESPILEGSRNRKVQVGSTGHVYASQWGYVLEKPTGPVSRAHGDVHPEGNPHIWLDPYNGRSIAIRLAEKLSSMDSRNAGDYKANLAKLLDRLDSGMFGAKLVDRFGGSKLWEWQRGGVLYKELNEAGAWRDIGGWTASMVPHANKPILTYHKSLSYFAARFALKVVDELEPKPGLEPSPGHLAQVIRTAQGANVKAIVQESFYSTRHAQFVASRIGAKVVVIPQNVGHDHAAKDYVDLFDIIVGRVSAALK